MAYNLGTNIGAVENGNPTGQAYATKVVRTYTLTTILQANAISQNGCVLASDGTNIGYKAIPIVTPFMNGTYPRHLTIQNIRVISNSTNVAPSTGNTGLGYLIFPTVPIGNFTLTSTQTYNSTQSMNLAMFYDSGANTSWTVMSDNGSYRTRLITLNQMIGTTANTPITNLYVAIFVATGGFTPVAGTLVTIQVDVSFE